MFYKSDSGRRPIGPPFLRCWFRRWRRGVGRHLQFLAVLMVSSVEFTRIEILNASTARPSGRASFCLKAGRRLTGALYGRAADLIWSLHHRPEWSSESRGRLVARLVACHHCPLFNRRRQTCGNIGNRFRHPLTQLIQSQGCLCHMPTKARLACNCWLYDFTNGNAGWRPELNDFEPEQT